MNSFPSFVTFAKTLTRRNRLPLRTARRPRCSASAETPRKASTAIEADQLPRLRKGDTIDIKISRLAYGGASVGHIIHPIYDPVDHSMPVFAPKGACPGDTIRCSVVKIRRRRPDPELRAQLPPGSAAPDRTFAEAIFTEPVSVSETAVPVPCKHFGHFRLGGGACGGCTIMQLPYELQLQQKQQQMNAMYASLAKANGAVIDDILPCEQLFRFRNKMEFSFGRRWFDKNTLTNRDEASDLPKHTYALGLHAPQRYDKIVHIDDCHIQLDAGNQILSYIRKRSDELLLEPYDTKLDTGYLKNIAIRYATNKEGETEIMVNIITGPCDVPGRLVPLAEELLENFPEIVCVLQNIRGVISSVAVDEQQERLLAGSRNYIEQMISGLSFRISANSFFQTNTHQTEVLYEVIRSAARLTKEDTVLDLFCGTGSITLCLAKYAKHVHGVDIVPTAIEDAHVNAISNGVTNATFVEGNLERLRKDGTLAGHSDVDVIVVDPPRAGLHPDLLKFIARSKARRIIYVSCNPASQVRDIQMLRNLVPGAFRVTRIEPVDMFPHTHHVECVTTLDRAI